MNMVNFWPDRYRGIDGTLESTGIVQGGVNGVPALDHPTATGTTCSRVSASPGVLRTTGWSAPERASTSICAPAKWRSRCSETRRSIRVSTPTASAMFCARSISRITGRISIRAIRRALLPSRSARPKSARSRASEPNTKTDNSLQYNLAIQRQLPKNMLVEMAYVGTKGTHLNGGENVNPLIPVAGRDAPLFNGVQLRRTYAGFGDMTIVTQHGNSTYHSFQSTLKQRINSTTFQLAYTFGKTLGDGDDSARYRVNTLVRRRGINTAAPKARSHFDRTHRVSLVFNHDLPNKFQNGFAKQAFNNWSVNGFLVAQTGNPLTVTHRDSGRNIGGGLTSTTATNLFANVVAGAPLTNPGSAKDNLNGYMNLAAFAAPAVGTFGNAGRGMFRGPGQWNLDFSAVQRFPVD